MTFRSRALALACATIAATTLAACGSSDHKNKPSTPAATPSTTPSSTHAAAPPKPPAIDPLTGGKPNNNPVYAVKVDDVAAGRPQVNVDRADVVYVEQVEGGLTRLIAVFNSTRPSMVGPVRSVRSNDPELLVQYGKIVVVASGGGGDALPALDASNLKANINDRGAPGFFRSDARPVPHNLFVNLKEVPGAAKAKSIGWTFSAATTQLKGAAKAHSINTTVGGTPVGFVWNQQQGRYLRVIGGSIANAADGAAEGAPNVIVQFCKGYVNPADIDPAGNPGHFTKTVGSGRVAVFRNGYRIDGTWNRSKRSFGTTLRDKHGKQIALHPGATWVILVTDGTALN